jgi:hypothetical protein
MNNDYSSVLSEVWNNFEMFITKLYTGYVQAIFLSSIKGIEVTTYKCMCESKCEHSAVFYFAMKPIPYRFTFLCKIFLYGI